MKTIIYRLLKRTIRRFYGLTFKPKGFILKINSKSNVKVLHHEYSINSNIDPFYSHLQKNLSKEASFEMKEVRIGRIEKGRILTNLKNAVAIIDEDDFIIGEFSFHYEKNNEGYFQHAHVSKNYFLKEKHLDPPLKVSGTVFSMLTGGGKNFNFYHWFFDVLSRLIDLKVSGWFDQVDYFLVPEYETAFQKESLAILGIKENQIISSVQHKHIQADWIFASSHPRTTTYSIRRFHSLELQRMFLLRNHLEINSSKQFPMKFFISRNDAPRRKILNEEQLSKVLLEKDIFTIKISDYTFEECIYLFRNAKCVISTHSAALTNIIFSQNNPKVIEIFKQNAVLPYYYELTKSLEMEYLPVILPSNKGIPNSRYQIQDEDIEFVIETLMNTINFETC